MLACCQMDAITCKVGLARTVCLLGVMLLQVGKISIRCCCNRCSEVLIGRWRYKCVACLQDKQAEIWRWCSMAALEAEQVAASLKRICLLCALAGRQLWPGDDLTHAGQREPHWPRRAHSATAPQATQRGSAQGNAECAKHGKTRRDVRRAAAACWLQPRLEVAAAAPPLTKSRMSAAGRCLFCQSHARQAKRAHFTSAKGCPFCPLPSRAP